MNNSFRELVEQSLHEALHLSKLVAQNSNLVSMGYNHDKMEETYKLKSHPHLTVTGHHNSDSYTVHNAATGQSSTHKRGLDEKLTDSHILSSDAAKGNDSAIKSASAKHNGHMTIIAGRATHIGNDHNQIMREHGNDPHVMHALAHNPTTPNGVLEKIAEHPHATPETIAAVARHPNSKKGTLQSVQLHPNLDAAGGHALMDRHMSAAAHGNAANLKHLKDKGLASRMVHDPSTSSHQLDEIGKLHPDLVRHATMHPNYNARSGQALENAKKVGGVVLLAHKTRLNELNK